MTALGPLSLARAAAGELIRAVRGRAPAVADHIGQKDAKLAAAEIRDVGAGRAFSEDLADDRATLEAMRRSSRHAAWGSTHGRPSDPEQVAEIDRRIAEMEATIKAKAPAADAASERANGSRRIREAVHEFLRRTDLSTLALAASVTPPKGATIHSVRSEIALLQEQIALTERAPADRATVVERLRAEVEALARTGEPEVRATASEPAGLAARVVAGLGPALLIWAFRDEIIERLASIVPADPPGALSPPSREKRLAELRGQLLNLERIEERLIEQAEAEGKVIARREGADVRAILGVEIRG